MTDITANRILRLLSDIEQSMTLLSAKPAVREIGQQVLSGKAGFGSRPPGDLRVLDLMDRRSRDAIVPKLTLWALEIAEKRNDDGLDDPGHTAPDLANVCSYLRSRTTWVLTRPDLIEGYLPELLEIRATLYKMPNSPLSREVIERMPCDNTVDDVAGGRPCVGTVETRISDRDGNVKVESKCRSCGKVYTDKAVDDALKDQAEKFNIVTAAVAVQRIPATTLNGQPGPPVTLDQIRNWSARDALIRHGKRGKEQTYDITEIARLAVAAANKRTTRMSDDSATVSVIGGDVSPDHVPTVLGGLIPKPKQPAPQADADVA